MRVFHILTFIPFSKHFKANSENQEKMIISDMKIAMDPAIEILIPMP